MDWSEILESSQLGLQVSLGMIFNGSQENVGIR